MGDPKRQGNDVPCHAERSEASVTDSSLTLRMTVKRHGMAGVIRENPQKHGRAARNGRGRPRKVAKSRTGGPKRQGSSAKSGKNADEWHGMAGVVRENPQNHGRAARKGWGRPRKQAKSRTSGPKWLGSSAKSGKNTDEWPEKAGE